MRLSLRVEFDSVGNGLVLIDMKALIAADKVSLLHQCSQHPSKQDGVSLQK